MQYWDKRVEIFGPEKAFQPLTLSKALSGDEETFDLGAITLPGTCDPSGRSIVYYNPARYVNQVCSACFKQLLLFTHGEWDYS